MNNIWTQATKSCQETITMEMLISQLEDFLDFKELNEYQITETFPKHGRRTYQVCNLETEIECRDGINIIMFDDIDHELKEDFTRVLNMVNENCVIKIIDDWEKEDNWKCQMVFKDGTIEIERL